LSEHPYAAGVVILLLLVVAFAAAVAAVILGLRRSAGPANLPPMGWDSVVGGGALTAVGAFFAAAGDGAEFIGIPLLLVGGVLTLSGTISIGVVQAMRRVDAERDQRSPAARAVAPN
jgi:hypothetical protein